MPPIYQQYSVANTSSRSISLGGGNTLSGLTYGNTNLNNMNNEMTVDNITDKLATTRLQEPTTLNPYEFLQNHKDFDLLHSFNCRKSFPCYPINDEYLYIHALIRYRDSGKYEYVILLLYYDQASTVLRHEPTIPANSRFSDIKDPCVHYRTFHDANMKNGKYRSISGSNYPEMIALLTKDGKTRYFYRATNYLSLADDYTAYLKELSITESI